MKLNINGYAQHGKDTVAELFTEVAGLKAINVSHEIAKDIMKFSDLGPYETYMEAYEDRVNHRKEWYDFIREQCDEDKTKYVRIALEKGDVYSGHRHWKEYHEGRHLVDATIWVDASRRGLPKEHKSSCELSCWDHDYVIDNGGSLEETILQVAWVYKLIQNRKVAENAY